MKYILNLIVFEHSIFALPFALASLVFALREGRSVAGPSAAVSFLFVVLAAVGARTAAMAFNRIVDLKFDRENPRTASRELVTGLVSKKGAVGVFVGGAVVFFLSAAALGRHCLILAPGVLLYLCFYSYTKRFTELSHLVLGGALALAPGGAWWVVRPALELAPLLLMGAVLFWVAGFDILYSLQDERFDRERGLCSIPAKLGGKEAIRVARVFHVIAFLFLVLVGMELELTRVYFFGLVPISGMFLYQHWLVTPSDLSRVNRAFFTTNGWVSVYYLVLSFLTS